MSFSFAWGSFSQCLGVVVKLLFSLGKTHLSFSSTDMFQFQLKAEFLGSSYSEALLGAGQDGAHTLPSRVLWSSSLQGCLGEWP